MVISVFFFFNFCHVRCSRGEHPFPGGRRAFLPAFFPPGTVIWQQTNLVAPSTSPRVSLGLCKKQQVRFFFFFLVVVIVSSSYMMATLPGTVPRMVRPAPGQNYPRTGFPLEGKRDDSLRGFLGFLFLLFTRELAFAVTKLAKTPVCQLEGGHTAHTQRTHAGK